jgi:hypothetical protein
MPDTQIADVIVPETFGAYTQQITEQRAALVQSGVVVPDEDLDAKLAGGGITFNSPSWRDLASVDANVSSDNPAVNATPQKTQADSEIQVRLSRNQHWSTMDLAQALAGADPAASIQNRVGYYWTRELQKVVLAVGNGLTEGGANPTLVNDISDVSYQAGVTDFSAAAVIDTLTGMNEAEEDLGAAFLHPIVYGRARKNNLIDFIPDSTNPNARMVPTFLGRRVIQDRGMFNNAGVFHTWLMGQGAIRWGRGSPRVPTEIDRLPLAGNGGGQEILSNRVEWCVHPVGFAFAGTASGGGPSNAATTGNLGDGASWTQVFPEREQIKFAVLVTREF